LSEDGDAALVFSDLKIGDIRKRGSFYFSWFDVQFGESMVEE
jgi:hypothetical protein